MTKPPESRQPDPLTESRRRLLLESWHANEQRIADAYDLKAGPDSPLERLADLEREQDLIEGELGELYFGERP